MNRIVNTDTFQTVLEAEQTMVLATSKENLVTARPVSPANIGMTIYIKTADDSQKALQMQANPNVAICLGNYQLEGTARFLGSPFLPENRPVLEAYKKKYADAFDSGDEYSSDKDVFVAIGIAHIREWIFENGEPVGMAEASLQAN